MQRLSLLFPAPLGYYDYLYDTGLEPGRFVRAPFGRRESIGVVWNHKPDLSVDESKLKKVIEPLDEWQLPAQTLSFVDWVAKYTLSPPGAVLKMALIPDLTKKSRSPLHFDVPNPSFKTLSFSPEQQTAVDELQALTKNFAVALLDGVTGSGKTEVYFETMAAVLREEKTQILVLLPEIILTTAWLERFEKRFGCRPALWHSSVTPRQRRDTWRAVASGEARVVVGARSALFLPFQNLRLLVVDEEHDPSFKQEEGITYHARDMAVVRAKMADCLLILSSATPSIETYCNVQSGRYHHIILPERFQGACFPDIRIVDMRRKEKTPVTFISAELAREMADRLNKKEQILLFMNRRGYAPLVLCRACGERLKCPDCSAWLVEHRRAGYLQCHHCGYTLKKPVACPFCQETESLISCGPGVERIEEEATLLFPEATVKTITSDTLASPAAFQHIAAEVEQGRVDILIGTQILAKGHHFPNLTLVGVIDTDMSLSGGDLRAGERTFQLLHQVMGRAGREQKKGLALLQSFSPENTIVQALKENNRERFLEEEIISRQLLNMPPFGRLAGIIVSGRQEEATRRVAQQLVSAAPQDPAIDVLGPVPAPLFLLRGKFRFRLLVKMPRDGKLQNFLSLWFSRVKIPAGIDVRTDIDPYSFF